MSKLMDVLELMSKYAPEEGVSWFEDLQDTKKYYEEYFESLLEDAKETGIQKPVSLGDDGTVWSGHDTVLVAWELGLKYVPVEYVASLGKGGEG